MSNTVAQWIQTLANDLKLWVRNRLGFKKNVYTEISDTHELVKIYILKTLIQILILSNLHLFILLSYNCPFPRVQLIDISIFKKIILKFKQVIL